jgi:hypothetical protein
MKFDLDKTPNEVSSSICNVLVIPGGVINPNKLRHREKAIKFMRSFFDPHKPEHPFVMAHTCRLRFGEFGLLILWCRALLWLIGVDRKFKIIPGPS